MRPEARETTSDQHQYLFWRNEVAHVASLVESDNVVAG
jgi:hypothetical protein